MTISKRIKRLAAGPTRHFQAWRGRHGRTVTWLALHDGGVVAGLGVVAKAEDIRITLRLDGGAARPLSDVRLDRADGELLAIADLPPGTLAAASRATITVSALGATRRAEIAIGDGLYGGHLNGIRDYALEGWVSPLRPVETPTVRLVVDGVPGGPVPLDRYRRELGSASGQGGWNGFRLPLPPDLLDGRPRRLAVLAGATTFEVGNWTAQPTFNLDATAADDVSGWFFDRALDDVPLTLRIVRNGTVVARTQTHHRPDVEAIHGRAQAGFSFHGQRIEPGSALIAGSEDAGILIGHLDDGLAGRVAACRTRARALLLGAAKPAATRHPRRAIRDELVGTERRLRERPLAFSPAGPSTRSSPPAEAASTTSPRALPPVCAIVPVYNGLSDLKLCLASLVPELGQGAVRALVIDDGSPDPAVARYLAALDAEGHPGLTILTNAANLGFIGTVNRGFALLEPGEDAVLVNADTILPPGVLAKLARCCHGRPGIASVTPMSNNATILSFPSTTERNDPALGLDVRVLDAAFAVEAPSPVEIPTGIGFCLYINHIALDEVGPLSTEWGRGYCEEVDWCLSARDLGWIHLAATDTFVIHEGSVSFGAAERVAILAKNHARLEDLYPEYVSEIRAFQAADPLAGIRHAVLLRLLQGRFEHLTLHLMHGLGGGTKRYVDDLRALPRADDRELAILSPVADYGTDRRLTLAFDRLGVALTLDPDHVEPILAGLERAGVAVGVHVNSRLTYDSTFLTTLLGTRPYVVMLHDFQWYCPRVHLTDERHFYCGEPSPAVCQHCVSGGVEHNFADHNDVIKDDLDTWLDFNVALLRKAERVLAPSRDTAERYARRLGVEGIVTVPHVEPDDRPPARTGTRRPGTAGALNLAVVGSIGRAKGYDLLLRMTERAARDRLPYVLTVVGITADDAALVRYGNAEVTGRYHPSELKAHLDRVSPDFVFLPSVWPETYSYVLSEIWQAGYSVVAFDLGAQAERIRAVGGGVLIPPTRDTRVLLQSLKEARERVATLPPPRFDLPAVATLDAYESQSRADAGSPVGRRDRAPVTPPPAARAGFLASGSPSA
ncbi:glycosyltransferase [Methylobacterium sp. Leaf108]|uniref:glycosyltransferase n=1 Tax=Methylobacterium sp. Leaf108 TaxID=1736256 RepID=UPI0006FADD74|nr:glycosyltransferase [Methylobacterium sp. Leaf108]KQP48948.1 hypothetical protein ASF39_14440 [Methylobacterium sp. Leaf108]